MVNEHQLCDDHGSGRRWLVALLRSLARPLPDATYLRLAHWMYYRRWPDFEHPRTLQEHIQAYVLRSRNPMLVTLADKLAVRDYIDACVGPGHTVPLLGAWRHADEVPLADLPCPVVLKPSHLSGRTLFMDRYDEAAEPQLRRVLADWLRRDHSRVNREWFYAQVPAAVVAEPLLRGADGEVPPDIKATVMGGRVRYFQVDRGRMGRHTRNFYGPDWSLLPARGTLPRHACDPVPPELPALLALAEKLAEPFEFLRVDCYLVDGRVLVGELTSSPGAGFGRFFPASFGEQLGAYWTPRSAIATPSPLPPLSAGAPLQRHAP